MAFKESEETTDPKARTHAFEEQEARLAEGVPYAPLFYPNTPSLLAPSLRGWVDNPSRYFNWKSLSLEP
jgi:ABC-type transport system substrate-binding protein